MNCLHFFEEMLHFLHTAKKDKKQEVHVAQNVDYRKNIQLFFAFCEVNAFNQRFNSL